MNHNYDDVINRAIISRFVQWLALVLLSLKRFHMPWNNWSPTSLFEGRAASIYSSSLRKEVCFSGYLPALARVFAIKPSHL